MYLIFVIILISSVFHIKAIALDTAGQDLTKNDQDSSELISLHYQDVEIRKALHLFAEINSLNIIISDSVKGNISLYLDNVPWMQAFDMILRSKNLDKIWQDNILLVGLADEIAKLIEYDLKKQASLLQIQPLTTELIQINYANSQNLVTLIKKGFKGFAKSAPQGSIYFDDRTNNIIVTDTQAYIQVLRKVLKRLDIPVKQVMIEARIVTASVDFSKQEGVRWGIIGRSAQANNYLAIAPSRSYIAGIRGSNSLTVGESATIDLGLSGAGVSRFVLGLFGNNYLLDLELSALVRDGQGEVIARPKVIATNNQTAVIASGLEIPYQETSLSGATTTAFKKADLSLSVTPQIIPNDKVIVRLQIHQDSLGNIVNGVPLINTNELSTQVLVKSGETVVLGGIYITQKAKSQTKTPFLGDIPILGRLFKRTINTEDKQELLIFITPKIIPES